MMRRLSGTNRARVRRHLRTGGIIVYPTESCYGLGCLPRHARALRILVRLKKRSADKGLIVIGANLDQFSRLMKTPSPPQAAALKTAWQGASRTLLLPAHSGVLPILRGRGRTKIGVRIPDHAAAQQLCRDLGSALVSTSANRAHARPCKTARESRRLFGRQAMVLPGRIGSHRCPSTITDWASGAVLR